MRSLGKLLAKFQNKEYTQDNLTKGEKSVRIAICDDERALRDMLGNAIDAYEKLPENMVVEKYSDGQSLINAHENEHFDIIFLDIEMGNISGMEAGEKIRSFDRKVLIILVTNHIQYMQQSFKLEVFDYITKPYENADVHNVLARALQKYHDQHDKVVITWKDETHKIEVGDIVYIEVENRALRVVTLNNVYKCNEKLDTYDKKLSQYGFFRCHNSILVNMEYIVDIMDKLIITEQGYELDMSFRKKKACLRAFNEFSAKYRI